MKKITLLCVAILVLDIAFTGCAVSEKQDLSEEKIESVFASVNKGKNWEVVSCRAVSDSAFDWDGVVLYRNEEEQTSNVAFIARDGYYQTCGVYAPLYDEPEFEYIGSGAVAFKLSSQEGEPYNCKVTFSEGESNGVGGVMFAVETS